MQEKDGKLRIKKLEKKINFCDVKFEIEVTSLIQKFNLIYGSFYLPLEILKTCTVIQKTFVGFSILEIKNLSEKLIGIRLQNDKGEMYQITLLEDDKTISTEYRVCCKDFNSIIMVEEIKDLLSCDSKKYSTFEWIQNKSSANFLMDKEYILNRMDQMIEENDRETTKVYTIRRKGF